MAEVLMENNANKQAAPDSGSLSKSSIGRYVFLIAAGIVSIVLIICTVVMLREYSAELEEQASVKALLYSTEDSKLLKSNVDGKIAEAKVISDRLSNVDAESEENFSSALRSLSREFQSLLYVRYFKGETEYTSGGDKFDRTNEATAVLDASSSTEARCVGLISDRIYNYNVIAYVAPVRNSDIADTVILYYPVESITDFGEDTEDRFDSSSVMTVVVSGEGEVLRILEKQDAFEVDEHNDIFELLRGKINDKETIDNITKTVNSGQSESFSALIGGDLHVISVGSVGKDKSSFAVIGLYRCEEIYSSGYTTVNTILGTLIVFFALLIILALYLFISRRRNDKRFLTVNDYDQDIKAPAMPKFTRDAKKVLSQNPGSSFAVVVMETKHFNYLSDEYDKTSIVNLLSYLKMVYSKGLLLNELYGYLGSGRFVLLIHYREKDTYIQRIKMMSSLARNYKGVLPAGYKIEICGGVYETKLNLTTDPVKMIEFASEAKDARNQVRDFEEFRIFNEKLQQSHIMNEYVEVHMNSALENKNFVVVYQPKYNVEHDRPDGCEALVRWYNPEKDEYMTPGIFLPLFESNGFIIKLDHYVYESVCEYISDAVKHGQRLYPVSVNVSRMTAIQNDFVEYYTSMKRKYNIADGFIMIEFTESFAYENYENLRKIIGQLHDNGFKCSIDDFGSGYSSFNLLKEIRMDEIKLDKFFIDKGISHENDIKLLSSVISLAKSLGMKVTQEGVETIDQLELLRKLGCEVIQGYHYSKPLFLSDYIQFIENASKSTLFVKRGSEI